MISQLENIVGRKQDEEMVEEFNSQSARVKKTTNSSDLH